MRTMVARALIAGMIAAGAMTSTVIVQAAEKKPAANQSTVFYDQYEPSQRQRLRKETCAVNEQSMGPYCTRKCDAGYLLVKDSKPPRCRSIEPLPPGQMPTAVRKQIGVQPPPPGGRQPLHKGNGQG